MCCLGAHLPDYIKCPGYADVKREAHPIVALLNRS
jgi:hypothetical protein